MPFFSKQNRLRTSFGLQVLSKEDSFENHPYSFSGLSDIYTEFMMDMAGAAEIPATRLFGKMVGVFSKMEAPAGEGRRQEIPAAPDLIPFVLPSVPAVNPAPAARQTTEPAATVSEKSPAGRP